MRISFLAVMQVWLACALLSRVACAQSLSLATRGKPPAYTIVRAANSSPSQQYAAEEFQKFTEELTGVKLPIVTDDAPLPERAILIGQTRYTTRFLDEPIATLGEDGFRLKTVPPHLIILGGPARGTLYGVYDVLERFSGCRWFTSWHSVIPRLDAFVVPALDETQRPAFALREPFWFDFFDGDLAARNKCNGNAMRLTKKHGGKIRFGGGLFCHTFQTLCPPSEFFETHPEYFSEINGQRVKERSQLCLTNPDVVKIVTERLLARIRNDPAAKLFSVSQNDWFNYCTCPACKAMDEREESHAGTMIAFVNQVAEAVEKEFPDVWIETLAYQYTRKPPKTVRPRHNVVVRLCTIECDFAQPLNRSAFEQNRRFVEDIRGWSAITDKLFVWDYTTNFRHYIAPFPNVLALQENVKLFRDHRVVGLFEQGAYQGRHGDFAELKAWLLAKWLWNPDLPAQRLLDDFFNGYYGAAAPLARQYFNEVHGFYTNTAVRPLRIFEDIRKSEIPERFWVRATELWKNAEAAVKDSPSHLYNVRMSAIPALFARLERLEPNDEIRVWVTTNPQRYAVPAEHRALALDLLQRFAEAKNIRISENQQHHEQTLSRIRTLAHPAPPPQPQTSAIVEDRVLSLAKRGTWGDTVKDDLAGDGSAMKLFNTHYEWCARLPFCQVAFDPGVKYRLSARLRVEKEPGKEGEAFWAGVYDEKNKKGCSSIARKTSDVPEGYAWYVVAEWIPKRDHYFWIGPGRFDKAGGASSPVRAVYLDCLKIERLD